MLDFSEVKIDKPAISIFGSGDSIKDLRADDIGIIKGETHVIFTNLIDIFTPHMRVWSDTDVTDYFDENIPKLETLVCSEKAIKKGKKYNCIHRRVNYTFDRRSKIFIGGSFTFFYILQLVKHYFPEKPVLLFGMDCKTNKMTRVNPETMEIEVVEDTKKQERHLGLKEFYDGSETLPSKINEYCQKNPEKVKNIYNCSPISEVNSFKKMRYLDVVMKECV